MKAIRLKSIVAAITLGLTAGLSMSTLAGQMGEAIVDGSSVPTLTVSFERSELDTIDGRAVVERRIRRAAEAVCGSTDHKIAGTLHAVARNKACYERAVDEAMAQIGTNSLASID